MNLPIFFHLIHVILIKMVKIRIPPFFLEKYQECIYLGIVDIVKFNYKTLKPMVSLFSKLDFLQSFINRAGSCYYQVRTNYPYSQNSSRTSYFTLTRSPDCCSGIQVVQDYTIVPPILFPAALPINSFFTSFSGPPLLFLKCSIHVYMDVFTSDLCLYCPLCLEISSL